MMMMMAGVDKVTSHSSLEDVIVVEGYTPEFDPVRVLATIKRLDPRAPFSSADADFVAAGIGRYWILNKSEISEYVFG
jgi:hypothetical protein